jgi:Reverse transcriptase (RNA-dependent DNA polymerase)
VYRLRKRKDLPAGAKVLPAVWAMRRKRRSKTNEVYRWKSRLNIGGHKQREGLDYEQTYAPVVGWPAIRLLLTMVMLHGWHTLMIDYVQAYPQAPVDRQMFMEIPKGFEPNGKSGDEYVLEILRNIYGQKQAGRVWNQYLVQKLLSIGFVQSKYDECVFYRGKAMYLLYTDDSILAGPDRKELERITQEMQQCGLKITVEGDIEDFLGVNIQKRPDGSFELTQKRLIASILEDLGLNRDNATTKDTPMASTKLLSRHPDSAPFDGHFHYRRVVGKLAYLEKCTRPDLAYAVHQCARFCADPKYQHGQAVKWIGRYLKGTKEQGMIFRPTDDKLDLYVDSDWSGNWDRSIAATDASTARSRHGYVLKFCGCPIFWASQLQTEIALSSTEAEYIGLSRALRETIPLMHLLKEMKKKGFDVPNCTPKVHCRVFEDNSGALEMANVHKMRPRTKHLNIKYHHFRQYVNSGDIVIQKIDSKDNVSDMLTKAQPFSLLRQHRLSILGWDIDCEKGCANTDAPTEIPSKREPASVNPGIHGSEQSHKVAVNLNPASSENSDTSLTTSHKDPIGKSFRSDLA